MNEHVGLRAPSTTDGDASWPPSPHDPRERELAAIVDGWEVRLFGGRKFQYFVTRGFWHIQLWHPEARVSILTPSRLTCGFYEAFPIANWKERTATYDRLVRILRATHVDPPDRAQMESLERSLVDEIVRAAIGPRWAS